MSNFFKRLGNTIERHWSDCVNVLDDLPFCCQNTSIIKFNCIVLQLYCRVYGKDLVPVNAFKPPPPPVALTAVRFKAVVLLLLIRC